MLVLGMVDIVLQELPAYPTPVVLWHECNWQLFDHYAFARPRNFRRSEHSF
jgi:hypothetical protein